MINGGNRIGTVSSIDVETGMVSVVYEDRDGEVTELLPYATFNDEYKLPQLGSKVVVLHLSNGGEMGIVLGTYWNENHSAENPGMYHKDISDGAYVNYDKGILSIVAEHIRLVATDDEEEMVISSLLKDIKKIKDRLGIP